MRHLLTFVLALAITLPAHARLRPTPAVNDEALHTLARTLVAEADWRVEDHAAIAHVLFKRWQMARRPGRPLAGISFAAFIREYSALWKPEHTRRKRAIRALPWGPLPRKAGNWGGKRWDKVRQWAERWNAGEVRDPCPAALQWGGTMDKPAGHWAPVNCGRTNNIFYAVDDSRRQS
jgi:hypothetical protein